MVQVLAQTSSARFVLTTSYGLKKRGCSSIQIDVGRNGLWNVLDHDLHVID